MLISIVTPTARRARFLPLLYACVRAQDWPAWEWLILDSSAEPAAAWDDPRVRYIHDPEPRSVGAKRNRLAELARGELIAHFDDDDYYAPSYLSAMAARLGEAAMVKLTGFFAYRTVDRQLGHWDLMQKQGPHFEWFRDRAVVRHEFGPAEAAAFRDTHFGYGFSFLYRRSAWEAVRFPDTRFDEDGAFMKALMKTAPVAGFNDVAGIAFAVQHLGNHAKLFPQTVFPPGEALRRFPAAAAHLEALHTIVNP